MSGRFWETEFQVVGWLQAVWNKETSWVTRLTPEESSFATAQSQPGLLLTRETEARLVEGPDQQFVSFAVKAAATAAATATARTAPANGQPRHTAQPSRRTIQG
ncbi:hypothetical protein CTRI78_v009025 [Colletotrichum trifolii]|uniref:Uncharacterized protein n=1 Tax=Colletotrichum trifolii TaxID=5466 RepID=A0A4R8QRU5_COLTR|nr:hypothetical protein CTRI78_v009025 [Colletotrichum trifolii]